MQEYDILILGAGWTATFLIPLCKQRRLSFAATTTSGHEVAGEKTIKWKYDAENDEDGQSFKQLPLAKAVLITFPLTSKEQSTFLVESYNKTHNQKGGEVHYILLGSTGIWQIPQKTLWVSRCSPYNKDNARAIAEDELLRLGGCVINLAGLWGGERDPKKWVDRVATTKEGVKGKKALHIVHGLDVARAILAVCDRWYKSKSQRWMLTDGFVYDWWALFAGWADKTAEDQQEDKQLLDGVEALALEGNSTKGKKKEPRQEAQPSKQAQWVYELMMEEKVWALPRSMETLARAYFGREFWDSYQIAPLKARV